MCAGRLYLSFLHVFATESKKNTVFDFSEDDREDCENKFMQTAEDGDIYYSCGKYVDDPV